MTAFPLLSDEQILSACTSYRHDFGLLDEVNQERLIAQAREWEKALNQERTPLLAEIERLTLERAHVISEGVMACKLAAAKTDECIALTEQVELLKADASPELLKLVCALRFAIGDNGQRMQPELVEFAKAMRADAERYQALRDVNNQIHEDDICVSDPFFNAYFGEELDQEVGKLVLRHRSRNIPDARTLLDAARAQGGE